MFAFNFLAVEKTNRGSPAATLAVGTQSNFKDDSIHTKKKNWIKEEIPVGLNDVIYSRPRSMSGVTLVAVSYTHLDVYKRQPYCCRLLPHCCCPLPVVDCTS